MNNTDSKTIAPQTAAPDDSGVVNHISEVRLRLPGPKQYIDAWDNLRKDEIVEQVVFFDDIYPLNTEVVTSFADTTIKDGNKSRDTVAVTCKDSPFIPSEELIPGLVIEAEFQTGSLGGRTFKVQIDKKFVSGDEPRPKFDGTFTLVPIVEKIGEDDEIVTPSKPYAMPKVGDQFVLKNVRLSGVRIAEAEERLFEHGKMWAKEHSTDTDLYTCQTDPVYCAQHNILLPLGQRVRLMDEGRFGPTGRTSRIQEYEMSLANPYKTTYTVGDNTPYSRLGALETSVQKSSYQLLPGAAGGKNIYLIQSKYDVTIPTDYNAYSAAATEAVFLSKNAGGTVKAPVRFDNDVATSGDVVSSDFRRDSFAGSGFGIYNDANGARVLEIDKVKVRKSLEVNELVTNQVTHIGGRQIYSSAGMEVVRVEETPEAWRCYMDTKQGQQVNRFVAGDQAYCQQYNAGRTDVTKYYWRLVTAVGEDYAELSKTDCDGDGVPAVGDNIAQIGNRTNPQRQSMYEIDQTTGGAVTQYARINAFSFEGKNYIGQYYDPRDQQAKFYTYGETYIGDRDPNLPGANYLTLQNSLGDDRKKLLISGQVHIGSGSTGIDNLEGWSEAQTKLDAAAEAARSANEIVGAIQGDLEVLRNQIDGQVECWFKDYNPTLANRPASDWPDEHRKQMHEGDTFTNLVSGYSWRWTHKNNVWSWEPMDAASARALASASAAQAALDGRCAVFLRTPLDTDAYDVGDLWMNATYAGKYRDELLRAKVSKTAGAPFSIDHWAPATKYTDDTAVETLRGEVSASVGRLDKALEEINADDIFSANEKRQIRTLWENINGVSGMEHPDEVTSGSYAQVLAAAAGSGEIPQPSRIHAFMAAGNEEFMVQKEAENGL